MRFHNIFLSIFVIFALGFALVQAEEGKPRGPKITNKVIHIDSNRQAVLTACARSTSTSSMAMRLLVEL